MAKCLIQNWLPRKSEVNKYDFLSSLIPIKDLKADPLSLLIFKLLLRFKTLTLRQVIQLLEVYDPYQQYVERNKMYTEVFYSLNKLQFCYKVIFFCYELNQWKCIKNAPDIFLELNEKQISNQLTFNPKKYRSKIIGKGDQFVYGLYIPAQKIESIINNYDLYPVKVGRTNKIQRRIKELSISGIETLGIDLLIKTNEAVKLEKYIHQILIDKSRQISIYGRKEWFLIRGKELEKIYCKYLDEKNYF